MVQGLGRLRRDPLHRVLFFKKTWAGTLQKVGRAPPGLGEVLLHLFSARRE